jgi:hypothetical protein
MIWTILSAWLAVAPAAAAVACFLFHRADPRREAER